MATKTNKAIKISQKHLLGIQDLSINDVNLILDEAKTFIKLNQSKNKRLHAPESWCLITIISGCIAFKVIAVSINVSPFLTAEFAIFIYITSAPNLFPANSNELCVLVEGSKNKLI